MVILGFNSLLNFVGQETSLSRCQTNLDFGSMDKLLMGTSLYDMQMSTTHFELCMIYIPWMINACSTNAYENWVNVSSTIELLCGSGIWILWHMELCQLLLQIDAFGCFCQACGYTPGWWSLRKVDGLYPMEISFLVIQECFMTL